MMRARRNAPGICKRFACSEKGSFSVEFALLFPLLVLMCLGIAELFALMLMHHRVAAAAEAGAEIIRLGAYTGSDDIEQAVAQVFGADSGEPLSVEVACADDLPGTLGSILPAGLGHSGDDKDDDGADNVPAGLVLVAVNYTFTFPGSPLAGGGITLKAERYRADIAGTICIR